MRTDFATAPRRRTAGMSLVETLIASGIGLTVLASAAVLFVYGTFSFAGLGNYAILTGQSRLSVDAMSREMRECTQVVSSHINSGVHTLVLTNGWDGTLTRYVWDSDAETLTLQKSGEPARTLLTGCERWNVTFYQRSPRTNWTFYATTDLSLCKLINMNWKCSRSILGRKINTENVVTAQVVLRNKP